MNKILIFTVMLTCGLGHWAFCDQKVDAKRWGSVEKFDPVALSKTLGNQAGKMVAVQFNFRGKGIHHIKPNWYEGSLWQPNAKARKGFTAVRVMLAKKDLPAFQAITTDSASTARLTVYGHVEYDAHSNFYFVRLLGQRAKVDSAGNVVITW